MLGEKALELVKELQRSRCGTLPPFNVSYCGVKRSVVHIWKAVTRRREPDG